MEENKLKWTLEIIWWLVTALVAAGVMYPIYMDVSDYPFWVSNVVFIVVAITAARLIFLLPYVPLPKSMVLKFLLIVACIPTLAYLFQYTHNLQVFLDEMSLEGWDRHFGEVSQERQRSIRDYVRSEALFFGTAAIIATALLPIRLVVSIWMTRNRATA